MGAEINDADGEELDAFVSAPRAILEKAVRSCFPLPPMPNAVRRQRRTERMEAEAALVASRYNEGISRRAIKGKRYKELSDDEIDERAMSEEEDEDALQFRPKAKRPAAKKRPRLKPKPVNVTRDFSDGESDESASDSDDDVQDTRKKMEAEGWTFDIDAHPAVGKRTRRFFKLHEGGAVVNGRIVAYIPEDGDDMALWKNQHAGGVRFLSVLCHLYVAGCEQWLVPFVRV